VITPPTSVIPGAEMAAAVGVSFRHVHGDEGTVPLDKGFSSFECVLADAESDPLFADATVAGLNPVAPEQAPAMSDQEATPQEHVVPDETADMVSESTDTIGESADTEEADFSDLSGQVVKRRTRQDGAVQEFEPASEATGEKGGPPKPGTASHSKAVAAPSAGVPLPGTTPAGVEAALDRAGMGPQNTGPQGAVPANTTPGGEPTPSVTVTGTAPQAASPDTTNLATNPVRPQAVDASPQATDVRGQTADAAPQAADVTRQVGDAASQVSAALESSDAHGAPSDATTQASRSVSAPSQMGARARPSPSPSAQEPPATQTQSQSSVLPSATQPDQTEAPTTVKAALRPAAEAGTPDPQVALPSAPRDSAPDESARALREGRPLAAQNVQSNTPAAARAPEPPQPASAEPETQATPRVTSPDADSPSAAESRARSAVPGATQGNSTRASRPPSVGGDRADSEPGGDVEHQADAARSVGEARAEIAATPRRMVRAGTPDTAPVQGKAVGGRLPEDLRLNVSSEYLERAESLTRIARQGRLLLAQDGRAQMKISLRPPDLGHVTLRLTMQDNLIEARIQVETLAARDAVSRLLPQIREALAAEGVQVAKMDVDTQAGESEGRPLGDRAWSDARDARTTDPDFRQSSSSGRDGPGYRAPEARPGRPDPIEPGAGPYSPRASLAPHPAAALAASAVDWFA